MDPIVGAALISAGGGLVTNALASGQSTKERAFNADQADKNRKFQERMSSTAYQRMKQDMESAGFNPLLGIGSGGASTPSGSQASTSATPVEDFVGKGLASAMAAKQLKLNVDKQEQEIKNMKSQKTLTDAEAKLKTKGLIKAEAEGALYDMFVKPMITGAKDFMSSPPSQKQFKQPDVIHNYPRR